MSVAIRKGFSILEALLVLGILALLFTISLASFSQFGSGKTLDTAALAVLSTLETARSQTIASVGDSAYGVHFTSSSVVLFKGGTYVPGDPNNVTTALSERVTVSSIALAGGGADVVFAKVTGKASPTGTITVQLLADASKTKVVTIEASGLARIGMKMQTPLYRLARFFSSKVEMVRAIIRRGSRKYS